MNSVIHAMSVTTPESRAYRFDRPRIADVMHGMFIRKGELGPGGHIGAFALETVDGGTFSNATLASGGTIDRISRPQLLTEGAFSDPAPTRPLLRASHAGRIPSLAMPLRQRRPGFFIASRNRSTHLQLAHR